MSREYYGEYTCQGLKAWCNNRILFVLTQDGITGSIEIKVLPTNKDKKLTKETKVSYHGDCKHSMIFYLAAISFFFFSKAIIVQSVLLHSFVSSQFQSSSPYSFPIFSVRLPHSFHQQFWAIVKNEKQIRHVNLFYFVILSFLCHRSV